MVYLLISVISFLAFNVAAGSTVTTVEPNSANKVQSPVITKSTAVEPSPSIVTLNSILFSEGNQSWTTRDFNIYKKLVHHLTRQEKLCLQVDSIAYDFMVSRLLKREALLFEIKPKKFEFAVAGHPDLAEYSKSEITDEIETIELVSALLDLKEKQMNQKEARFKAWVDVLKRKYSVRIKANEFIN